MVRKWTLSATGFAVLATTFVVVACSSKADDDDDDNGGNGGTGGTTSGTAGKPPMAGTSSGGSSGSGTTGGTGGSSGTGTTTGGTAGTSTSGGAGGAAAGAGGSPGFACNMPATATCNSFDNWSTSTGAWWGSGMFSGGFSIYGSGLVRDTTVTDKIHITGTVSTYSGFNIWFNSCSTLASYTGVSFVMSGTSPSLTPDMLTFNPQTNSTYPYTGEGVNASGKKGTCTPTDLMNPYGSCIPAAKTFPLATTPTVITWADMEATASGTPVKFTAAMSPAEIVGLQWQFPWGTTETAYMVDITLDQLTFTSATPMPVDCGTTVGGGGMGSGGMGSGGMGGAAAGSGGMGGATGGQGGATTGGATGGGQGGRGGATSGGRGGRGGAAGSN